MILNLKNYFGKLCLIKNRLEEEINGEVHNEKKSIVERDLLVT